MEKAQDKARVRALREHTKAEKAELFHAETIGTQRGSQKPVVTSGCTAPALEPICTGKLIDPNGSPFDNPLVSSSVTRPLGAISTANSNLIGASAPARPLEAATSGMDILLGHVDDPPRPDNTADLMVVRLIFTALGVKEEQVFCRGIWANFAGVRSVDWHPDRYTGHARAFAEVPICAFNHSKILEGAAAGCTIRLAVPRRAQQAGARLQHHGTGSVSVCPGGLLERSLGRMPGGSYSDTGS